jgi:leucyl aminopeptidase
MDFSIKTFDARTTLAQAKTGVIVVGVFENKVMTAAAAGLDGDGAITAAIKSGDITGKAGSTLLLRSAASANAERVLLLGLGKEEPVTPKDFTTAVQALARMLSTLGAADALVSLPFDRVREREAGWAMQALVLALRESRYRFDELKSKKEPAPAGVRKVTLVLDASTAASGRTVLAQAEALANGVDLTKDLGNLPPNICTPTYLANTAKKLAKQFGFGIEVLDRKQMEALKMGSLLSVTNGSVEPPKFIVLKHLGGKTREAPTVLVGKGVTFDSGGISIKPGAAMDEMKYDMCGAASVLGTFRAIGEMGLKLNVIGRATS